jgi:hypothetical protein
LPNVHRNLRIRKAWRFNQLRRLGVSTEIVVHAVERRLQRALVDRHRR